MTLNQAIGLLTLLGLFAAGIITYVYVLKKSHSPGLILFKTGLTVVIVIGFGGVITRMMLAGGYTAIAGIFVTLTGSAIVAIIWREHLTNLVARPFESLFTGGDAPPEPEAFYSIARTKRQQQRFDEAIEEIHEQLERFPDDFTGLMMLAEIQAVDQHNLSGAAGTVERILATQPDKPRNCAIGLNALADWHLSIGHDREAARRCLERVLERFPKHTVAMEAEQRLAHLPTDEFLEQQTERRRIVLTEHPKTVIRNRSDVKLERTEEPPDEAIARLVGHLELHPKDRDAREELAVLYAHAMRDVPLAVEQLEFLLRQAGQNRQYAVKCLNLLADFQIKVAGDLKAAEAALDRIIKKYPGSPAAEQAGRRRMLLGRELKGNEKSRDVSLGSYERDMGLR